MSAQRYDLNDLQYQTGCLLGLLEATHDQILDMDFGTGSSRNHELDRVSAMVAVARDYTESICGNIEKHFHAIQSKGGAGREAAE